MPCSFSHPPASSPRTCPDSLPRTEEPSRPRGPLLCWLARTRGWPPPAFCDSGSSSPSRLTSSLMTVCWLLDWFGTRAATLDSAREPPPCGVPRTDVSWCERWYSVSCSATCSPEDFLADTLDWGFVVFV